jgi:hypothetical protein
MRCNWVKTDCIPFMVYLTPAQAGSRALLANAVDFANPVVRELQFYPIRIGQTRIGRL